MYTKHVMYTKHNVYNTMCTKQCIQDDVYKTMYINKQCIQNNVYKTIYC